MTTATLALDVGRPPRSMAGVSMAEYRLRINVTVDPDALATLDALAAGRYGGNRSRALDDCMRIGAAVLGRPAAYGLDPAAALAAYCRSRRAAPAQREATMTSWQYAGTLFRSRTAMIIGMVSDFVTAQGMNDPADILADHTDDDIADGIGEAGWLDCSCDPDDLEDRDGRHAPGCMVGYAVDRGDVLDAVAEYRADVALAAAQAAG